MSKNKEAEKSVSIRFPILLLDDLIQQAKADDRSINGTVLQACKWWLAERKKESRPMYNKKQQAVVDAFLSKIQSRHKQEMAEFGQPQSHDNREYLEPIKEIIGLFETDTSFTSKDVVEGLGEWAGSMALKEMKRLEEHSYEHPVNGRILIEVSSSKLKYQWMNADE